MIQAITVRHEREEVMSGFWSQVKNFLAAEDGPTAVEYAVMLPLIVVVGIAANSRLGSNASGTFSNAARNAAANGSSS